MATPVGIICVQSCFAISRAGRPMSLVPANRAVERPDSEHGCTQMDRAEQAARATAQRFPDRTPNGAAPIRVCPRISVCICVQSCFSISRADRPMSPVFANRAVERPDAGHKCTRISADARGSAVPNRPSASPHNLLWARPRTTPRRRRHGKTVGGTVTPCHDGEGW
jgi:hypothetical protein